MTIQFIWQGPYSVKDIFSPKMNDKNERGLYFWFVEIKDQFCPYYIGRKGDVIKRIRDHIVEARGGKKSIPDLNIPPKDKFSYIYDHRKDIDAIHSDSTEFERFVKDKANPFIEKSYFFIAIDLKTENATQTNYCEARILRACVDNGIPLSNVQKYCTDELNDEITQKGPKEIMPTLNKMGLTLTSNKKQC